MASEILGIIEIYSGGFFGLPILGSRLSFRSLQRVDQISWFVNPFGQLFRNLKAILVNTRVYGSWSKGIPSSAYSFTSIVISSSFIAGLLLD
jgi:hypothetical protein